MMKYKLKSIITGCYMLASTLGMAQSGYIQKGKASYYADKFNGRSTASGEVFDNEKLTAAHKKLKFNTMVKVTNLENGKSVVVRINDRGPFAAGRIIDLSKSAAQKIDMIHSGVVRVEIEVIDSQENNSDQEGKPQENKERQTDEKLITGNTYNVWGTLQQPKGFGVQIGSFQDFENAQKRCKEVIEGGISEVYIQVGWSKGKIYRVLVGAFPKKNDAKIYLKSLKKMGFDGFTKHHFD